MISSAFVIFFMLIFQALCVSANAALESVSESKVLEDANQGNKRAKKLIRFESELSKYAISSEIISTLSILVSSTILYHSFSQPLIELINSEIPLFEPIFIAAMIFGLLLIHMVFGRLIPKRIAFKYPLKTSYLLINFVIMITYLFKPFVWLFHFLSAIFGRLFGLATHDGERVVTEEEIRNIVEESSKVGSIDEEEGEMIQNVFDFSDTTVDEIMTHRTDIQAISVHATKNEIIDFILREQYTRFPVYKENIDHIIGTLHVKDLFKHLYGVSEIPIKKLIRPPYFIPESKKNSELFKEMQKSKNHIAIVLDEYGGTAGLVTIEDLVEEILGNIADEYDTDDYEIKEIESGIYIVDGLMNINDVEDVIEANLPTDEYDTISGFILGQLGRFPHDGEDISILYQNYQFQVISIKKHVISSVRISKIKSDLESDQS
jgi:putative hemolysin